MEFVPARADVNHRDVVLSEAVQDGKTELRGDTLLPGLWTNRHHFQVAGVVTGVPPDVAEDQAVVFGQGDVAPGRWVVERRHLGSVVVLPVRVVVREDVRSKEMGQVSLEERSECVDRQMDESRKI